MPSVAGLEARRVERRAFGARAKGRLPHPLHHRHQHRRPKGGDDAGYGIIEMVITIPAMITLVMFVVQFALVWHARHVAQAAAEEGLRTGRAYTATAAQGQARAEQYLHAIAPNLIVKSSVDSTPTATTLTVAVDGEVTSLVPFATFHVHESATGPIERFVAPGGG